jgi:hypothetical protein
MVTVVPPFNGNDSPKFRASPTLRTRCCEANRQVRCTDVYSKIIPSGCRWSNGCGAMADHLDNDSYISPVAGTVNDENGGMVMTRHARLRWSKYSLSLTIQCHRRKQHAHTAFLGALLVIRSTTKAAVCLFPPL